DAHSRTDMRKDKSLLALMAPPLVCSILYALFFNRSTVSALIGTVGCASYNRNATALISAAPRRHIVQPNGLR
ncbi:MAG: hypothetical protein WAV79_10905, partial [Anaerolineae bacterium]